MTNVGPWSGNVCEAKVVPESCGVDVARDDEPDIGSRRQPVVKVLNNGVEDETTACHTQA